MFQLPAPIESYLHGVIAGDHKPACLLIGRDGLLLSAGGDLAHYGLADLVPGEPATDLAYYLEGMLPLTGHEEPLYCLHTASGTPADIHFLRAEEGDYVLLLDATEKEKWQRVMQQKGNDASLLYQRLLKEIERKDVLLHCIVHDLAGPLLGIRGGFELLGSENLTPQGRKFIEIGLRQADKQEKLIREILHAFSAELETSRQFHTDRAQAPDAAQTITAVVDALTPAATLNHVNLRVASTLDLTRDWKVIGERSRLERVISNLVENALRYSPADSTVTVGCYEDERKIVVAIDDEGPGIPPDMANQLFQKFAQGKKGKGKVGLGLYFCRITIEHWGGQIGHAPRAEKGTRFWFRLSRPAVG